MFWLNIEVICLLVSISDFAALVSIQLAMNELEEEMNAKSKRFHASSFRSEKK